MDDNNIQNEKDIIDLGKVFKTLWEKRKTFYIVLPIVFVLSCIWIFPQPRYYTCEVKLAPEGTEDIGGIASIASSFGFNVGEGTTTDAIYPTLYPDLFESPEFIADLFKIRVVSDDETIKTDYYTYLRKHQKKNWLTAPFVKAEFYIKQLLSSEKANASLDTTKALNPFKMNKIDFGLVELTKKNISCKVDKKTDVITISVKDQDRQICALLADSIKERLQDFIIEYRTKKVRQDVAYYQHLADSAKLEYKKALITYGSYNDGHRNVSLQTYVELGDQLRNDMNTKLVTYNTFNTQLVAAKAKVQERTPSFTTLKSATVPLNPAGPKRMLFIIIMETFAILLTSLWLCRKIFSANT